MTKQPQFDHYIEALRDDLPSLSDEMRIRHRMAGAGIAVAATVATKAAVGTTAIAKVGLLSTLMTHIANLPLLTQLGLVTAGTAALATGPVVVVSHFISRPTVTQVAPAQSNTAKDVLGRRAPHDTSASSKLLADDVSDPNRAVAPKGTSAPDADVGASAMPLSSANVNQASERTNVPATIEQGSDLYRAEVTDASASVLAGASRSNSGESTGLRRQGITGDERAVGRNATLRDPGTTDEGAAKTAGVQAGLEARHANDSAPVGNPANAADSHGKANDNGQLAEETRLIDAALWSIRNGNLPTARRLLNEHALRFPYAKLAKERGRAIQKLQEAERHAQP